MLQLLVGIWYPANYREATSFSPWAVFTSFCIIAVGIGGIILWAVTGKFLAYGKHEQKAAIGTKQRQKNVWMMRYLARESPFMPILVASLFLAYGMLRAQFGPSAFNFVLDKALCYMLLFTALLMEVLSGLHLMPRVPAIKPSALSLVWWTVGLFAFQVFPFTIF